MHALEEKKILLAKKHVGLKHVCALIVQGEDLGTWAEDEGWEAEEGDWEEEVREQRKLQREKRALELRSKRAEHRSGLGARMTS